MKRVQTSLLVGLPVTVMFAFMIGCNSAKNDYQPPPPPDVTVTTPVQQQITPFMEQNGVVEAVEEADVRSRVLGFVESIDFEPGREVTAGQVLYQIEPDQYEAAVNSAQASVESAEAAIEVAKALVGTAEAEAMRTAQNLVRERSMMEKQAGSQAQLDAAIAENDAAVAALKSAKANVQAAIADKSRSEATLAQAKLDLGYTTVTSPIDGRIAKTDVKTGNLVENGTKLTAVVNHERMFANFSVSDREILRLMKAKRAALPPDTKLTEPDWSTIKVYLRRESDDGFPITGFLDYVDQEGIDPATGTLGLRAVFENADDLLIPGLFVTIRMPLGDPRKVTLVPEYAVLRDQRGQYCLVINAEKKVERANVSVSQNVSGWSVVESGLTMDSRIVIDGVQRARPGLEVNATDTTVEVSDLELMRGIADPDPSDSGESDKVEAVPATGDAETPTSEVE